jgi:hypothetical protein
MPPQLVGNTLVVLVLRRAWPLGNDARPTGRQFIASLLKRAFEISRQLKEEAPLDIVFQIPLFLEAFVHPAESGNVAALVEQMMETKILQCRQTLLSVGERLKTKGAPPPLVRSRVGTRIDGEEVEIQQLLLLSRGYKPVGTEEVPLAAVAGRLSLLPFVKRVMCDVPPAKTSVRWRRSIARIRHQPYRIPSLSIGARIAP